MKVAMLGTGVVGQTLTTKLVELGHDIVMGTRDPAALTDRTEPPDPGAPSFADWRAENPDVPIAPFAQAAEHGEIVFLVLYGSIAVEVVEAAAEDLAGKVVVDVTNPLDFSTGHLELFVAGGGDSLAERMQRAVPDARIVKSLCTVTARVMVEPRLVGDDHVMFVAGDDEAARAEVSRLLRTWFGWREILDLGDLSGARAMEGNLLMWVRLLGALGDPMFNIAIRRA